MITRARRWNTTCSWKMAWVPTTILTLPSAMAASASSRALPFCLPASQPTLMPRGASQLAKLTACCSASSSVGAISPTWQPLPMACSAAKAATSVLPEPTSPCTSRIMGWLRCRSWLISATTRFWAPVGLNGRALSSFSTRAGAGLRVRASWVCAWARTFSTDRLWASSSSSTSRCWAGCWPLSSRASATEGGGRCSRRRAAARSICWG
ncbi:hypothetical protein D3C71_523910 [compost metagenome]